MDAVLSYDFNPLQSPSPEVWNDLLIAVGPASLLLAIETRMSHALRARHSAEDVFQEAMLHAWRDRGNCRWSGIRSFRCWLLAIIDHRIRDLADHESALKRGGGASAHRSLGPNGNVDPGTDFPAGLPGPIASTTPSRVALYREQAQAMREALETLPQELSEVVRLRLIEQMTIDEVAQHLNIGEAAVRHRFRRGAEQYHQALTSRLASRSGTGVTLAQADAPAEA